MKKLAEEKAKFEQISKALGSELNAVKADVQQFSSIHEKRVHDMNEALLAKSRKRAARRVYLSKKRAAEERKRAAEALAQPAKIVKKVLASSFADAISGGRASSNKAPAPTARGGAAGAAATAAAAAPATAADDDRDEAKRSRRRERSKKVAKGEKGKGKKTNLGKPEIAVKVPSVGVEKEEEKEEEGLEGGEGGGGEEPGVKGIANHAQEEKAKEDTTQRVQLSVRPDGTMSLSLPISGGKVRGSEGISEEIQGMLSSMLAPVISGRKTYENVKQREALRLSQTLAGASAGSFNDFADSSFDDDDNGNGGLEPRRRQRQVRKSKRQKRQRPKAPMWNTMPVSSAAESESSATTRNRKRSRRALQTTVIPRGATESRSPARAAKKLKSGAKLSVGVTSRSSGSRSGRKKSTTRRMESSSGSSYGDDDADDDYEDEHGNSSRTSTRLSRRSSSVSPRRLAKRSSSSSSMSMGTSTRSRASGRPVAMSKSMPSSPRLPAGFRNSSRVARRGGGATPTSQKSGNVGKGKVSSPSDSQKVKKRTKQAANKQGVEKEAERGVPVLPATPTAGLEDMLAEIESKGVEERENELQEKRRALAADNAAQIVKLEQAMEKRRREELFLLEETHFETKRLKQDQVRSVEEKKTTELIAEKRAALAADLDASMSSLQSESEAKRRRGLAALEEALEGERQRVLSNVSEGHEKKLGQALADLATEMHRRKESEASRVRKELAEEFGKKLSAARTEAEARHGAEIRRLRKTMRERSEASLTSLTKGLADEHVAALAQVRVELEKESKANARKMRDELSTRHKSRAARLASQIMDASSRALDKERTRLSKEYAELERAQGKQLSRKLRKERKEAISVLRLEMGRKRQVRAGAGMAVVLLRGF